MKPKLELFPLNAFRPSPLMYLLWIIAHWHFKNELFFKLYPQDTGWTPKDYEGGVEQKQF